MDHWLAHTLAAWLAPAEETAEAAAAGHVLKTDEIDTVQLRSECSVKDHGAVVLEMPGGNSVVVDRVEKRGDLLRGLGL